MSFFSLRIPDDLMEEAKKPAAENSTSLNQFFLVTIAAKIGDAKTKKYIAVEYSTHFFAWFSDSLSFRTLFSRFPKRDWRK